ncbi:hypothetical protein [Streptomyces sp. NBC_01431]|uniref:hypothetical protein n=1 Tax=Streptomyces sp. NBC_01431 TaxID=2903863 RepID=UPI002E34FDD7|nr:hypothetical protein [Streptomyces sp. NBC_01431]
MRSPTRRLCRSPRPGGRTRRGPARCGWSGCDDRHDLSATTAARASAALQIAGASQEAAACSLAEAARALPAAPQAAADALTRAAASLDGNAEVVAPAWLVARAGQLREG